MNINWFLGFSEGEGNFTVLFHTKRYKDKKYVWAMPIFQLVQAEQKVIDEVTKFLEEQGIKPKSHKSRSKYSSFKKIPKVRKDTLLLQVSEIESSRKMIKLLDSLKWHTQKRSDFEKWKKCIAVIMEHPDLHRHGRKSYGEWKQYVCDLLRINHIAQDMNLGRRRVWTLEHLINYLKAHKPYKDFDFVKEMRTDGKLEENLRILEYS